MNTQNFKSLIMESINSLQIKEKTFSGLKKLIDINDEIDGHITKDLIYEFGRIDIRINEIKGSMTIVGKMIIKMKLNNSLDGNNEIGYYEFHTNQKGQFIDEFFVLNN